MLVRLRFLNLVVIVIVAAVICGCGSSTAQKVDAENLRKKDPVEEILGTMTLEEKIGQMLIVGVYGTELNDDVNFMLGQYRVGGIIFFDRNMETREQVKNFVADMNFAAAEKVPLFICLDEEGGRVSRMKHALPPPPSQEEIGATGNPNNARTYANLIGQDLKAIGVNVNFAPVADVGTDDTRSFSDNAEVVADFVLSAAKGYEDAGIFYCLKHFPGIGRGQIDSHEDVSTVYASREVLEAEDLLPFRRVIAERDNSKFMVMVGHLKYEALDAENSATLSPAVMNILRENLGYTGVIVTDDLDMGAVVKHHSTENLGVAAVKAGADIVLSCHDYASQQKIYNGIFEAVERGEIPVARIDESVRRILKMKLG